jgi:nickel/cobalt transporter (NicO) family protein
MANRWRSLSRLLLSIGLGVIAVARPAAAHPHVFIDNVVTFVFAGDKITGLRLLWRFDEVFSETFVQDFDADADGSFSPEEVATIKENSLASLKEYGYFTHLWIDGQPVAALDATDLMVSREGGSVIYDMRITLAKPVDPRAGRLEAAIYDDSYFIEVALHQPVRVRGRGRWPLHVQGEGRRWARLLLRDRLSRDDRTDVLSAMGRSLRALVMAATIIFLVGTILLLAPAAPHAETGTAASPEAAPAGPSVLKKAMARFVRLQRDVNRALSDGVVALKDGQSSSAVLVAMMIAFAYGVLHAIGPGHGKAVILGYFLARDGSVWRGVRMGAQIALLHVISAVVIVVIVRWLLGITFAHPVDQLQALKLFSYGAITAVGLVMLARSVAAMRRPAIGADAHDCHHHRVGGEGGLLSLAVGLIPCSGAVLVLIYALANDLVLSGLIMTACIAVGMAATLSAIGIAAVWVRTRTVAPGRSVGRRSRFMRAGLDLFGPAVIALLGVTLLTSTLV